MRLTSFGTLGLPLYIITSVLCVQQHPFVELMFQFATATIAAGLMGQFKAALNMAFKLISATEKRDKAAHVFREKCDFAQFWTGCYSRSDVCP